MQIDGRHVKVPSHDKIDRALPVELCFELDSEDQCDERVFEVIFDYDALISPANAGPVGLDDDEVIMGGKFFPSVVSLDVNDSLLDGDHLFWLSPFFFFVHLPQEIFELDFELRRADKLNVVQINGFTRFHLDPRFLESSLHVRSGLR